MAFRKMMSRQPMNYANFRSLYTASEKLLVVGDADLKFSGLLAENRGSGANLVVASTTPKWDRNNFQESGGYVRKSRLEELEAKVTLDFETVNSLTNEVGGPFNKIMYIHRDASNVETRKSILETFFRVTPPLLTQAHGDELLVGAFPNQKHAEWDLENIAAKAGFKLKLAENYELVEEVVQPGRNKSGSTMLITYTYWVSHWTKIKKKWEDEYWVDQEQVGVTVSDDASKGPENAPS